MHLDCRQPTVGTLLFVVLWANLGACMVGPSYIEPEASVNTAWIEQGDSRINTDPADYAAWWTVFGDPILDELVDMAAHQNLSLRIAGLRVLEAMAQRGIAVGEFFPQSQALSGGFSRSLLSDNTALGPAPTRYANSYDASLDVAWELDFWGRFRRGIESADAGLEASLADYDAVMVSLVAEVASTYVRIRTIEEQLSAVRANIAYQEQSYQLAQAKFDAGATSELDVAFSQAILRETEALMPEFGTQLAQAKYLLSFLLGRPPSDLSESLGDPAAVPDVPSEVAIGIPADLLRRRPDVRSAERLAAAQCALVGVAEADFYPAISVLGSIGLSAEHSNDLLEGRSGTGEIGPGFSWPVLNYGRIENNVRFQDALFQEQIVTYRNTVLRAAGEVEDSLIAFLNSQEQVRLLTEADVAAERAVQLALIQYREGAASYAPVLLALEFLVSVKNELAVDRGQTAQSLVGLYKALGGGWELRVPLVPPETEVELRARTDWGDLLSPDYSEGSDFGFPRPDLGPRVNPDEPDPEE